MCGIAGMHRVWGEEAAKSYPRPPPCPLDRLPSASTQLGVREGSIAIPPHPPFSFFLQRPKGLSLAPWYLCCFTCFSQSHKNVERIMQTHRLARPSTLPPSSKICNSLGACPKAQPPLQCMRSPLSSAQRCCFVCPGSHILYIYILLQSLSLEKLYILL